MEAGIPSGLGSRSFGSAAVTGDLIELAAVADEPATTVFDPTDQGFRSATLAGAVLGAVLSAELYGVEHLDE